MQEIGDKNIAYFINFNKYMIIGHIRTLCVRLQCYLLIRYLHLANAIVKLRKSYLLSPNECLQGEKWQ